MVAVLAGGRSLRMGQDKATIPFHGRPLIEHILSVVHSGGYASMVVGRTREELETQGVNISRSVLCIPDEQPGLGPVGGLATALHHCPHESLILIPCDVPNLLGASLHWLVKEVASQKQSPEPLESDGAWAVVPTIHGRAQPLFAAYSRAVETQARGVLGMSPASMQRLLSAIDTRYVDMPQEFAGAVADVDTPEQLENTRRLHPS